MNDAGSLICSYIVDARFEGKQPFRVGMFTVARQHTRHDTETAARSEADASLAAFVARHFPDGTPTPSIIAVRLGSMVFVPDDVEIK